MKTPPLALALILGISGCRDQRSDYQQAASTSAAPVAETVCATASTSLPVDTAASVVYWKGTKFGGRGKHEGTLRLSRGEVEVCGSALVGGTFEIDMRSIEVTDIPEHEPVPRARLRDHLMGEDFFAVDTYPAATFRIDGAEGIGADSVRLSGALTMRGKTQGIAFKARIQERSARAVRASAQFSIDRQRWGVAYRGSELTNDLVDDELYLDVRLVARG